MSAHAIFYHKLKSKTFLFYILCLVCVGLVAGNIMASQQYNKIMYGVMEGQNSSIISYLKHIWGTPLFSLEMQSYATEGRSDILSQWAQIQKNNNERIQIIENATRIYPYSPELYYNLYLLYSENGSVIKARESLRRAQQIDPSIQ